MACKNPNKIFCKRTAELLEQQGLTQVEMGQKIGITQGNISKIINGEYKTVSADTVYKIAKYLGVTTDYLLGLSDIKTPNTATQEICTALGINDDTLNFLIEHNKDNDILNKGIDKLIKQHNSAENNASSILNSLAYILALSESNEDMFIRVSGDGTVYHAKGSRHEPLLGWDTEREISLLSSDMLRRKSLIDVELDKIINCSEEKRYWHYLDTLDIDYPSKASKNQHHFDTYNPNVVKYSDFFDFRTSKKED